MAVLDRLRTGDWLTRSRMRLWAIAVLAAWAAGVVFLIATANGLSDNQGRPLGSDFSNVYAAGTYVRDGRPEAPFDGALQHAREKQIFGDGTPFYGWHYPPFFLFVAAALALMPYVLALAVWQGVTILLYLLAIRAVLSFRTPSCSHPTAPGDVDMPLAGHAGCAALLDPLWLLFALGFPAVFVNLGHGHNGFLTAALLAGALILLDRRPILAGILFGALAYKPQFGLLIPLVLVATGRWRTVAAATATVVGLAAATTLAFGLNVWTAFLAGSEFTRTVVLEQGDTGWHKIQSVFAWARMWGGSVPLAYALQAVATLLLAAILVWLWRSPASYPLKAAALLIAAILATPYSLDYDMMVLAPAIAFVAVDGFQRGFGPYEKTALVVLWFVPLVARSIAQATVIPIGVIAMLTVFAVIVRRAASERGTSGRRRGCTGAAPVTSPLAGRGS
jgi:alpha-1,2-mannosyltransferase